MQKTYFIITGDGIEVVDETPEAEIRLSAMDALEERYHRRQQAEQRQKLVKNPLWKLASFCGLI